jgi:hypothetical protein
MKREAEKYLTAPGIADRLEKPLRTVQRWLSKRPDIFPNAYQACPNWNSPYLAPESDVVQYEEKYMRW